MTQTWMRPERALVWLAGVYATWQAATGLALFAAAWRDLEDGFTIWASLGMIFGIPFAIVLAALGRRMEGALHQQRAPAPALWLVLAFGVALGAHWIAVASWPVGLLAMALIEGSSRALERAGLGFGVLLLAGIGVGVAAVALRARQRRTWPTEQRPLGRAWLPVSLSIGAAYVCSCGSAALLGTAWLAVDGWDAGSGAAALVAWVLAGGAATVCAAGLTELWRRSGKLGARTGPYARLEIAGGVLTAHWLPVFGLALTPLAATRPDLQWALIGVSFGMVLLGTWVWALGRPTEALPGALDA